MADNYTDEQEKLIHNDFTVIMDNLVPMGKDLLQKFGTFHPSQV